MSELDALLAVADAANAVDALVSYDGPPFRLDGERITGDAELQLLSLHDALNDLRLECEHCAYLGYDAATCRRFCSDLMGPERSEGPLLSTPNTPRESADEA